MLIHALYSAPYLLLHHSCFLSPAVSFFLFSSCFFPGFALLARSLFLLSFFAFLAPLFRFLSFARCSQSFSLAISCSLYISRSFSLPSTFCFFSFSPILLFLLSPALSLAPFHLSWFKVFFRMPPLTKKCFGDFYVNVSRPSHTSLCACGRAVHGRGDLGRMFAPIKTAQLSFIQSQRLAGRRDSWNVDLSNRSRSRGVFVPD